MSTIREILKTKGNVVHSIAPESTVLDATRLMNEYGCGAVVVVSEGEMVGVFTERDVLRRVVAAQRGPSETLVSEVMTTAVACCSPDTSVDEARGVMKNRRIRHLPALDEDGRLVGMVSIGDLNAFLSGDQETTIHMLQEYLHGRV